MTTAENDLMEFLAARRSREPEPETGLSTLRIAQPFLVIAGMLAIAMGVIWFGTRAQANAQANAPARAQADANLTATVMAEKFVTQNLYSPSTAKYPLTADVRQVGDKWRVSSHVDSQNRFGAMLRTGWTVEMKADGDTWTLTNLEWNQQ